MLPTSPRLLAVLTRIRGSALVGVVALACCGIAGWVTHITALASMLPGALPMVPVTIGLLLLFAGVLFAFPRSALRWLPLLFAATIVSILLGVGTFIWRLYLPFMPYAGLDIDALLHISSPVNHISPVTSLFSIFTGVILLLRLTRRPRLLTIAGWLAVVNLIGASAFFLAYLDGNPLLYGSSIVPIAFPTVLAFLLLNVALICSIGPAVAPLCWFTDGTTRAKLLVVFLPITLSALILVGYLAHVLPTLVTVNPAVLDTITAVGILGTIVLAIAIASRQVGRDLDRSAAAVRRSEAALRAESERLLVTLHAIGDGVIVTDVDGCVVMLNPVAEAITGWSQADACGQMISTVFTIVNEQTQTPAFNPVHTIITSGVAVGLANHTALIARDGTIRSIADSGAPILDLDGQVIGVILVFRDVTEERRAEHALRESEERYSQLFSTMTEGVALHEIICAEDGSPSDYRFLAINPAFEALTGLVAEQTIGRTVRELLPDIEQEWIDRYGYVALTGEPITFTQFAESLGRSYDVVAYSPRHGQFAALFKDITELKQTQAALDNMLVALTSANDAEIKKQKMLLSLHEVQNELSRQSSVEGLCRAAVECARKQLGFDRASLWFVDETAKMVVGSYGIDERGHLRDERGIRLIVSPQSVMGQVLGQKARVIVEDRTKLHDAHAAVVGTGMHAIAALWDGGEVIGCLSVDNLLSGTPIRQQDSEFLELYATMVGHLYTQKQYLEALRETAEQLNLVLDSAQLGTFSFQPDTDIVIWNDRAKQLWGFPADTPINRTTMTERIHPEDRPRVEQMIRAALLSGTSGDYTAEYRIVWPDDSIHWLLAKGQCDFTGTGAESRATRLLGIFLDITERKRVEEALRVSEQHMYQASKMESIGQLAGGIAHDFNNILTGIIGMVHIAADNLATEHPARTDLDEILALANRAANLTRQLLAFSRRQPIEPRPLDINCLITQILKMLQRLIGEEIALDVQLTSEYCIAVADLGQLEQVLVNLAVNARDAMPTGGTLRIATAKVEFRPEQIAVNPEIRPGSYVSISVTDTGHGMDPVIQQHIFEPFFTTKEVGKGTGLGLATVYGIIKQHNGIILVNSALDQGTTFQIYLPYYGLELATETADDPVLLG